MRNRALLLVCCVLAVAACEKKSNQPSVSEPVSSVLAKVNSSAIYQDEFDLAVERTLGETGAMYMNEEVSKRLLDSLIASRAMALTAEKELAADQLHAVEIKTQAYREELLVKIYLQNHAIEEPVTAEMVQQYYDSHKKEFGEQSIKRFEWINAGPYENDADRDALLNALADFKTSKDWKMTAQNFKNKGLKLSYVQAEALAGVLEPALQTLVANTAINGMSDVHVNASHLHIVQVLDARNNPAKPLHEVSAEIRRSLAPIQLKKAIKGLTDNLLKTSKIEYVKQSEVNQTH